MNTKPFRPRLTRRYHITFADAADLTHTATVNADSADVAGQLAARQLSLTLAEHYSADYIAHLSIVSIEEV